MSDSTENALAVLNILLASMRAARTFGINYRAVADMQAVADAEDRELDNVERQTLLDKSQGAIGKL